MRHPIHEMHVALNVADLPRSTAFYEALLGIGPSKRHDDYVRFTLDNPPLVLALNPNPAGSGPDRLSHLGIKMAPGAGLAEARERLGAAGIETREEAATTCCYAVQDKLWATDPDGNSWEFYQLLADSETHSGDAAVRCCQGVATDERCCP